MDKKTRKFRKLFLNDKEKQNLNYRQQLSSMYRLIEAALQNDMTGYIYAVIFPRLSIAPGTEYALAEDFSYIEIPEKEEDEKPAQTK